MKLKFLRIESGGNASAEAVWLKVTADCNLNTHILADTTYDETRKSNLVRHTFWFPDRVAQKDDFVVIYTRKGKNAVNKTTQGKPLHRLFWNLEEAVWNDEGDLATLLEIAASIRFAVPAQPDPG